MYKYPKTLHIQHTGCERYIQDDSFQINILQTRAIWHKASTLYTLLENLKRNELSLSRGG